MTKPLGLIRWPVRTAADARFWLKVYPRGDCWEWRGFRDNQTGYGRFNLCGTIVNAHRFAFTLAKGQPPGAKESCNRIVLDHVCRVL